MQRGTVVGAVWSTRRIAKIPAGALLEIELEHGGARLIALDVLGTGIGERVIIVQGSVAAAWFESELSPPVDALVIGAIDDTEPDGAQASSSSTRSTAKSV